MRVKDKLIYGISSILCVFILSAIIMSFSIKDIENISEQTSTESLPMAMLAADSKFQSCQIQQFLTDSSLTQDAEVIKEAQASYDKFMQNLNEFEKMFKSENNQSELDKLNKMREKAKALFDERSPLYEAKADIIIDVEERKIKEIVKDIISVLKLKKD